jgi:hypothetical protein
MDAYKKVGFGSFKNVDPEKAKKVKMTAPDLGGVGGWWALRKYEVFVLGHKSDIPYVAVPIIGQSYALIWAVASFDLERLSW